MPYPKEIKIYPKDEAILRTVSQPVTDFGSSLKSLFEEMERLTKLTNGFGFSAIQMGVPLRACVIRQSDHTDHKFVYVRYCNIEVLEQDGDEFVQEGCLSCPGLTVPIHAPENVIFKCQDDKGISRRFAMWGIEARCCLHELRHQNGGLIIDEVNKLKLGDVKKKYLKDLRKMGL
jgi:peptide deformylase